MEQVFGHWEKYSLVPSPETHEKASFGCTQEENAVGKVIIANDRKREACIIDVVLPVQKNSQPQ